MAEPIEVVFGLRTRVQGRI